MPAAWFRTPLVLLLAVALLITGCSGALRPSGDGDGTTSLVAADSGSDGYTLVRHGHGDRAALYALVGVLIVFAFIVDLILVPVGCHDRDLLFPCCRSVVYIVK